MDNLRLPFKLRWDGEPMPDVTGFAEPLVIPFLYREACFRRRQPCVSPEGTEEVGPSGDHPPDTGSITVERNLTASAQNHPLNIFDLSKSVAGEIAHTVHGLLQTLNPIPTADAATLRCDGAASGGCNNSGSYGMGGMYSVDGRTLCPNCTVKDLGIGDLPGSQKILILV